MTTTKKSNISDAIREELKWAQYAARKRRIDPEQAIEIVENHKSLQQFILILCGGRPPKTSRKANTTNLYVAWVDDIAWVHAERREPASIPTLYDTLEYLPDWMAAEVVRTLLRKSKVIIPDTTATMCEPIEGLPNVFLVRNMDEVYITTPWFCTKVPRYAWHRQDPQNMAYYLSQSLGIKEEVAWKMLRGQMSRRKIEQEIALAALAK